MSKFNTRKNDKYLSNVHKIRGANIRVPSIYKNLVFSQSIGPIELKFHVKTSYDKLSKMYANNFRHMTKMAATPIYDKTL